MIQHTKKILIPSALKPGDEIRIIAPSKSMEVISKENRKIAENQLKVLGLKLTYGKHVLECDLFDSSSVQSRIEDLHDAFIDPQVKGIFTVLGGYNSNQLLSKIDYEMIHNNPKVFCGFSDITALQNAFLAQSQLVTYSGPHYSTFAMKHGLEYTLNSFKAVLFHSSPFSYSVTPSKKWSSDSEWFLDQENRNFETNLGPQIINEGEAEGIIIGGNLGTFNLLKGTPYMPSLKNSLLFIEDTESGANSVEFDRNLQSLIDMSDFHNVKGLIIGRFEKSSDMTAEKLISIIKNKPELNKIPIIYNCDFGHTTPIFTFPIGGLAQLKAHPNNFINLKLIK